MQRDIDTLVRYLGADLGITKGGYLIKNAMPGQGTGIRQGGKLYAPREEGEELMTGSIETVRHGIFLPYVPSVSPWILRAIFPSFAEIRMIAQWQDEIWLADSFTLYRLDGETYEVIDSYTSLPGLSGDLTFRPGITPFLHNEILYLPIGVQPYPSPQSTARWDGAFHITPLTDDWPWSLTCFATDGTLLYAGDWGGYLYKWNGMEWQRFANHNYGVAQHITSIAATSQSIYVGYKDNVHAPLPPNYRPDECLQRYDLTSETWEYLMPIDIEGELQHFYDWSVADLT